MSRQYVHETGMASVGAFNDMMATFLSELQKTLPNEKGVTKAIAGFELMRSANPRKVVDTFMTSIAPYSQKIATQDATFMDDLRNVEGLRNLNLAASWQTMSPNTQESSRCMRPVATSTLLQCSSMSQERKQRTLLLPWSASGLHRATQVSMSCKTRSACPDPL